MLVDTSEAVSDGGLLGLTSTKVLLSEPASLWLFGIVSFRVKIILDFCASVFTSDFLFLVC